MLILAKYWKNIIIVILLIVIALMTTCKGETKTIRIPAVVNELPAQPPVYLKPETAPLPIIWKSPTETISIPVENPVNDSLVLAYQKIEDSLERFKLYLHQIQIRTFENTFEDEYIKLNIKTEAQGFVNWVKPTYTIKSREIELPSYHRILAGAEIGNNTSFNDFRYKVNISLQNPKGDIYKASYSKQFGQDYIWLGYEKSLFSF